MKKIILTVLTTFIILFLGLIVYVKSGSYDISQTSPHNGLTKWLIRQTTKNSIEKRIGDNTIPAYINDSALMIRGFHHYNSMCVQCHGGPGVREWEMAEGLYPKPPKMYKHKEQEDLLEFYWIIKNGIKMTSMPAYGPTHNETELWAMTVFVVNKLNKMTPEEYADWSKKYADKDEDSSAEPDNDGPEKDKD